MNGLDSPLEALAFNPVNLSPLLSALFNNLWAFIAILTATLMISFRHLRKMSPKKTSTASNTLCETVSKLPQDNNENVVSGDEVVAEIEGNSISKKFFNVYYDKCESNEGCVDDDVYGGDEEDDVEECDDVEVVDKWMVEMTAGGGVLGWYEFQDRRVINGSVVKLWEGNSSPRGCRSKRTFVLVSKVENVRRCY